MHNGPTRGTVHGAKEHNTEEIPERKDSHDVKHPSELVAHPRHILVYEGRVGLKHGASQGAEQTSPMIRNFRVGFSLCLA